MGNYLSNTVFLFAFHEKYKFGEKLNAINISKHIEYIGVVGLHYNRD